MKRTIYLPPARRRRRRRPWLGVLVIPPGALLLALGVTSLLAARLQYPVVAAALPRADVRGVWHVHTTRSDGRGGPPEVARAAHGAGLSFVVLTDHNPSELPAPVYEEGVLLIPGQESSTPQGHVVVLGASRALTAAERQGGALNAASALGGFSVLAHPTHPRRAWTGQDAAAAGMELWSYDTSFRRVLAHPITRLIPALGAYLGQPVEGLLEVLTPEPEATARLLAVARSEPKLALCALDAHGIPPYGPELEVLHLHLSSLASLPADASAASRAVTQEIAAGRFYCALDILAPAAGFSVDPPARRAPVGSRLRLTLPEPHPAGLQVRLTGPATLLADGRTIRLDAPGAVLVEVWVRVPGLLGPVFRPWILPNPVTVAGP